MPEPTKLRIELLSDATFGRGEGTAGEVDTDVEHDELGLPYLGGKSIHGLFRDAWLSMSACFTELDEAALRVLGPPGDLAETAILRVGDAAVEPEARAWFEYAVAREDYSLTASQVLRSLTEIRRQTAEERSTGAPAVASLRATRVIIRGLTLEAPLHWLVKEPSPADVRCLALCALGVRHAGLGRNRGRGHVRLTLNGSWEETCRLARGERS